MNIFITILVILLYAVAAALLLELAFWIISLFIEVPPKIRKLVYALVGVLFIIQIVMILFGAGGAPEWLPWPARK